MRSCAGPRREAVRARAQGAAAAETLRQMLRILRDDKVVSDCCGGQARWPRRYNSPLPVLDRRTRIRHGDSTPYPGFHGRSVQKCRRTGWRGRGTDQRRPGPLVRWQPCRVSSACAANWWPRGELQGAEPGHLSQLPPVSLRPDRRGARRAPDLRLHARPRRTPARTTTGWTRPRRARKMRGLFAAACAGARCTSCPTAWARSIRRTRAAASRSPTAPTSC